MPSATSYHTCALPTRCRRSPAAKPGRCWGTLRRPRRAQFPLCRTAPRTGQRPRNRPGNPPGSRLRAPAIQ